MTQIPSVVVFAARMCRVAKTPLLKIRRGVMGCPHGCADKKMCIFFIYKNGII